VADEPRIVAELGRPATPEDIRDRRAASRSFRMANQTTTNLLIAVGATLLVMAFLIVVVVRPDQGSSRPTVDWQAEASAVQGSAPGLVLSPTLPDGWTANRAAFGEIDDTESWIVGFLTPDGSYLAMEQGFDATGAWLRTAAAVGDDDEVLEAPVSVIGGRDWWVLDRRDDAEAPGNHPLVLATTAGIATVVLHGTASDEEFATLAGAIRSQLNELENEAE
jgi:hypothetical protein